ncbi:MAG: flagellar hook-basal body complex protein FliE [Holophaga sp.]|nr:flagellar hook-basal body complex protein FliE [Holophaga sp.]
MDPLLKLNQLPGIQPLGEAGKAMPKVAGLTEDGSSFGDLLKQAMQEVDAAQHTAQQEARNLMTGEATDMHSAILAVQKADVSFQMMMAVRSKLIEAYREVMRMQM